jgi:hypothetical protein
MKTIIIAAAAALAVTAWVPTGASAQPDIRIGPGGIRIDTDRDRRDRWDRRDRRDDRWDRRRDRCRTIIERERRRGRIIETRRTICR